MGPSCKIAKIAFLNTQCITLYYTLYYTHCHIPRTLTLRSCSKHVRSTLAGRIQRNYLNKTLSMVCTLDWPANITAAPYGPGVGVLWRKRRWSLKVTLHYSTSVSNCSSELYRGGGGALALKVTWHNSLEFGNASSLLVHSCCCCTSSLDWTGQCSIKRCQQSMCGEVDEPPMHCNVVLHCSAQCTWMNVN